MLTNPANLATTEIRVSTGDLRVKPGTPSKVGSTSEHPAEVKTISVNKISTKHRRGSLLAKSIPPVAEKVGGKGAKPVETSPSKRRGTLKASRRSIILPSPGQSADIIPKKDLDVSEACSSENTFPILHEKSTQDQNERTDTSFGSVSAQELMGIENISALDVGNSQKEMLLSSNSSASPPQRILLPRHVGGFEKAVSQVVAAGRFKKALPRPAVIALSKSSSKKVVTKLSSEDSIRTKLRPSFRGIVERNPSRMAERVLRGSSQKDSNLQQTESMSRIHIDGSDGENTKNEESRDSFIDGSFRRSIDIPEDVDSGDFFESPVGIIFEEPKEEVVAEEIVVEAAVHDEPIATNERLKPADRARNTAQRLMAIRRASEAAADIAPSLAEPEDSVYGLYDPALEAELPPQTLSMEENLQESRDSFENVLTVNSQTSLDDVPTPPSPRETQIFGAENDFEKVDSTLSLNSTQEAALQSLSRGLSARCNLKSNLSNGSLDNQVEGVNLLHNSSSPMSCYGIVKLQSHSRRRHAAEEVRLKREYLKSKAEETEECTAPAEVVAKVAVNAIDSRLDVERDNRRYVAALSIQSAVRRLLARRLCNALRSTAIEMQSSIGDYINWSVSTVQRYVRGRIARTRIKRFMVLRKAKGLELKSVQEMEEKIVYISELEASLKVREAAVIEATRAINEKAELLTKALALLEERAQKEEAERAARSLLGNDTNTVLTMPARATEAQISDLVPVIEGNNSITVEERVTVNGHEWLRCWDESSLSWYWFCEKTEASQWNCPLVDDGYESNGAFTDYSFSERAESEFGDSLYENGSDVWQECWDEAVQSKYWYNHDSGEATWAKPLTAPNSRAASPQPEVIPFEGDPSTREQWVSCIDETIGQEYWFNPETGETSWS